MKRIASLTAILMAMVLFIASCSRTLEPDSTFISGSDIQLKVSGRVIYTYDPLTWQLGYNPTNSEFRASDDAMKNWFFVTCSAVPSSVGQKMDATVTWSSGSATNSVKGKFEVVKAERDTYWLWCGDKKIQTGVTICILR